MAKTEFRGELVHDLTGQWGVVGWYKRERNKKVNIVCGANTRRLALLKFHATLADELRRDEGGLR